MSIVDAVAGNIFGQAQASVLYVLLGFGEGASAVRVSVQREELMCKDVECAAGAASQVKVVGALTSFLS